MGKFLLILFGEKRVKRFRFNKKASHEKIMRRFLHYNYFKITPGRIEKIPAYALLTEPNSSIFSLTVALIASKPGARSFLGSKPLPC